MRAATHARIARRAPLNAGGDAPVGTLANAVMPGGLSAVVFGPGEACIATRSVAKFAASAPVRPNTWTSKPGMYGSWPCLDSSSCRPLRSLPCFIAYFLMDDKPYYRRVTDRYPEEEDAFEEDLTMAQQASRDGSSQPAISNTEAFQQAKQKFADLEERLRSIESRVTSSRFELQRELQKISGDDA
ncbi:MAG: hypothetical protein U5O39_14965 [Gammaproteobacteria bacterium]|nr:hypothetical protein [Gammaproteobacteria bacterium]